MFSKNGPEPAPSRGGIRGNRKPWSLSARLTVWYAGSAFTLVLAVVVLLYWALVGSLARDKDLFLADEVQVLRAYLGEWSEDSDALKREVEWESPLRRNTGLFVRIRDKDNQPVAMTPGMSQLLPPEVFPSPTDGDAQEAGYRSHVAGGRSFRLISARAKAGKAEDHVYTFQVAVERTEDEVLLAGYRMNLWIVVGLASCVSTLGGYWLSHKGIRPIREIIQTARHIRSTTLNERIAPAGLPAELADLAETFNEMLTRLEESFARLSRFSADIAHELRTPLNNLRGEAEVALRALRTPEEYRDVLGNCLEECGRLSHLVNCLLFLARAESPEARISRGRVEVGRELRAIRDFYEAAASEAAITLAVESQREVVADLDRTLFQRAIGNLLENALTHTDRGGLVTVRQKQFGSTLRVEVSDTGRGIPEEHLPQVFDRFYRVDAARSASSGGVGLGLSIVKSIAELHGGSVEITSHLGHGTSVTLILPIGNEHPRDQANT